MAIYFACRLQLELRRFVKWKFWVNSSESPAENARQIFFFWYFYDKRFKIEDF